MTPPPPTLADGDAVPTQLVRVIQILAVAIGLAIAICVPVLFGAAGYYHETIHLRHHLLAAQTQVSRYAYTQGSHWDLSITRLGTLLGENARFADEPVRQKILDPEGKLIYAEEQELDWPIISRRVPIEVAGETEGWVEIDASFRGWLLSTLLVALASLLVGMGTIVVVHRYPMRILSRTFGALTTAHARFEVQLAETLKAYELLQAESRKVEDTSYDLTRALEEAQLANRTKSEFLAAMSHELRTPLNAIIGFSELMSGELLGPIGSPKYVDYANDITQSGQHLLAIINDILDLSKIEAGKMSVADEQLDLDQVIRSSLRFIAERARSANVKVAIEIAEGPLLMRGDAIKVKQILLNLLSNAVKFTPAAGRVEVHAFKDGDGRLLIVVKDTGCGMKTEDIPKALEPFRQVDSSLNRRFEGTGLGLPLSKRLIELHGGTLTIDSTVDVGTEVTVAFPAARVIDKPVGSIAA